MTAIELRLAICMIASIVGFVLFIGGFGLGLMEGKGWITMNHPALANLSGAIFFTGAMLITSAAVVGAWNII